MRDDLLRGLHEDLPSFLDYRIQNEAHSNFNTPPVFAIYVTLLVTHWLINEIGGLSHMHERNLNKAELIYGLLDRSDTFYRGRAELLDRSMMNVVFNMATPEMETQFLKEALAAVFFGLSGHRTIGGIRASIYDAVTVPAAEKLVDFMEDYWFRHTGGTHASRTYYV